MSGMRITSRLQGRRCKCAAIGRRLTSGYETVVRHSTTCCARGTGRVSPRYCRCIERVFGPRHAGGPRRVCCGLYSSVVDLHEECRCRIFSLSYERYGRGGIFACHEFRTVLGRGDLGTTASRSTSLGTPAPANRIGVQNERCFSRRWAVCLCRGGVHSLG